ncbi:MAG: hypothetical protein ABSE77_00945 [Acidimicrobiales bacterium]|jgi:hypothetical protein
MNVLAATALPPAPTRRPRRSAGRAGGARLVAQIKAGLGEDPGPGGWSGGFANQAHWDPARSRDWRCWAQTGPTWSAHCGAEVAADDPLGLCHYHRRCLLEGEAPAGGDGAGPCGHEGEGQWVTALAGART